MANHGGKMKSVSINGVKMYTISSHLRSVAAWLSLKKQRSLRKDKSIYPPQVKVYELRQFSMKFERHLESEIIDFQVLADDYSKLAFLCADRSVNLHAKYGEHYSLRIPRFPSALIFAFALFVFGVKSSVTYHILHAHLVILDGWLNFSD
ncbi:hypothetical protein SCA6_002167 [Theobroma cacao]|uniref:Nucleolar protein 10 isoform X1 n=1 Tax=Theobroma cacao TaxID=3641 RepID=A0AB32WD70_THECC|nr:PREDICTED: nucleolar protein 10 isoform X1 [Theobroma cacao]